MAERAVATTKTTEAKQTCPNSCKQKPVFNYSESPAERILQLQRTAGNQAVQRFIKSGALQAKLRIGQPNDIYEQEADRVAEQVMRMPRPQVSNGIRVPNKIVDNHVQRKCPRCKLKKDEEEKSLQAKEISASTPEVTPELEANINAVHGGGQPLPESTRAFFETRFGHDFRGVRTHSGAAAEQSAKNVNAHAYTVGSNIVFGAGRFAPETHEGRRLIAHELTHVVQQGSAKNNRSTQLSIQKTTGYNVMRNLAFESTVKICHRVLTSRSVKVSQGGLRVVLILNQLDKEIPNCQNHKLWVSLTKSVNWWPDEEIATCEAETGRTRSFSFGNLSSGTYYLTIHRVFDNPNCCIEGDILTFDEPINAHSSSCISEKGSSIMDIVHGALDLAGFIPVLGAIPDGVNAAIYVAEGDWANAGLSAVAMVPAWGDGVKLGVMAGKSAIKISEKAAIRLGEKGIAKGLKDVKAVSKVEKATLEATEGAGKLSKAEKETAEELAKVEKEAIERAEKEAAERVEKKEAERAEKEAAERKGKEKKDEKKGKKGKWGCQDVRCNVYQNQKAKPLNMNCPPRVIGEAPYVFPSFDAACKAAQVAANLLVPKGCIKRHCNCETKCTKK